MDFSQTNTKSAEVCQVHTQEEVHVGENAIADQSMVCMHKIARSAMQICPLSNHNGSLAAATVRQYHAEYAVGQSYHQHALLRTECSHKGCVCVFSFSGVRYNRHLLVSNDSWPATLRSDLACGLS